METKTLGPVRPTILVIDDDPDFLRIITRSLIQWKYEVLTASKGEEGLRLAAEQRPDLILLDIHLPTLSGHDVCRRLKADPATQAIPVVFLTACGESDDVKTGMALGAEDYLVKPIHTEALWKRLKFCLPKR